MLGHVTRRPAGRVRRAARRIRSSSAPRPTRSSRAGPTSRTRCSRRSCARRCDRAEGRRPRLPLPIDVAPTSRGHGHHGFGVTAGVRRSSARPTDRSCDAGFLVGRRVGPDGSGRRARRRGEFVRHVVHHPGAVVVVPVDDDDARRHGAAVAGGDRIVSCSRSPRASATSTASRPKRPPAVSSRRRSGTAPAVSSRCASSTTPRASATSTRTCSSPPSSCRGTRGR